MINELVPDERKEDKRLREAHAYRDRKLYKAFEAGQKARDRKQPIKMNPFSAVSQPFLHAAWITGFSKKDNQAVVEPTAQEKTPNEDR